MAWLHTWAGLVPGWVLYFIFVTGTVGYFYVEIDLWMQPERHPVIPTQSIPQMLEKTDEYLRENASEAERWRIYLPTDRYVGMFGPGLRVLWTLPSADHRSRQIFSRMYYPDTDTFLAQQERGRDTGGGNALYRMHEYLHYMPADMGEFIVFVCSLMMFVTMISGIITHKKIFRDFFTFRKGTGQRAWLDIHNISSVLALPFMIMITYSGLAFYMSSYMPDPESYIPGNTKKSTSDSVLQQTAVVGNFSSLLPLTHFFEKARHYWNDEVNPFYIEVLLPSKSDAEVRLLRSSGGTILRNVNEQLHFSATNGHLIRQITPMESNPKMIRSVLFGLHEGVFAGPILRWLYFGSGLLGCIMIGSGLVLWTVKRRRKQEKNGKPDFGFRLVETLNIGTIAG